MGRSTGAPGAAIGEAIDGDRPTTRAEHAAFAGFSAPVRTWFATTFAEPTAAQAQGWPAITRGDHTLILAPTGSGKTLTAFLWTLDRLVSDPVPARDQRLRTIYLSPLRALAVDVDRNLRAPLRGISLAAERLGVPVHEPVVGVRTGDTPADERQRMARRPPDILITTPESLFLLLTSQARATLRHVDTVIVDEIHALAPTKRGSHLALSLERLEHEVARGAAERGETFRPPQRIALSATQRPLEEVATFLGGHGDGAADAAGPPRPVTIVDAGTTKALELEVVVPIEDMTELGTVVEGTDDLPTGPAAVGGAPTRRSIWPAIHPRLLDRILEHRSTLVFVNARRLAERLAARLNELHAARIRAERLRGAGLDPETADPTDPEVAVLLDEPVDELVKAHHGSLSKERRRTIEDDLKAGRLRGLVATSSLELGIDMGAVDLVVQVASPGAVSRGLQRIGRAGHQVGQPSRGTLFPKYRGDLLETAVVVRRMQDGLIEETRFPRNPLDVLAQQVVAMAAMDEWAVADLARLVRRSAPFAALTDEILHAVLDLLAGRYPSDEFAELRPRIVWDRVTDTIRGRPGAQRLAVTNPGTIPDRGLYGVFLADGGTGARVGELDEEMVFESRPGETFVLGASTWRIEDITHDRVVVTPAPGQPGKLPFWHGDGPGRPVELGRAVGAFTRELAATATTDREAAVHRLQADHALDAWAADNLVAYLEEQTAATGALPDDRTVVVERFRDEIGDWRICLLTPFGAQVHAPWAMAIERRLADAGLDPELLWSDDGIVIRLPEAADELPLDDLVPDPEAIEALVVEQLGGTALFSSRFREAAGRALLLPKRRPGQRTALWQQRQRAADLLAVAARYPTFPITLEATRECLRDVFDLPALRELLTDLRSRKVRLVPVETEHASPFAQSLLFAWVGQYMYEYDAPLAERRATALALDRDLLRELLGSDELRELIDEEVLAELELELQHLTDDRHARSLDAVADLLRIVGDLTTDEVAARTRGDAGAWLTELEATRRAIRIGLGEDERWVTAEDAARVRDGLGVALPPGLPAAFTEPVDDPLADLVSRYARTHGPFRPGDVARRLHVPVERVRAVLDHLVRTDRVVVGEFRPGGVDREWIDTDVLRRLRRRSLAVLRREVEPVDAAALGRFLPLWHGIRPRSAPLPDGRRLDVLAEAVGTLQGAPVPASVLETDVLPARVPGYRPSDLDALVAAGEVVWFGTESLGARDGRVVLAFRDQAAVLAPAAADGPPDGDLHAALRGHLAQHGASFWPDLQAATGLSDQDLVLDTLWDLVWAGEVTNDTLQPLRALVASRGPRRAATSRGRPRPGRLRRVGPAAAEGRWSLTTTLRARAPDATTAATARAEQLLLRHGILTRESLRIEALTGGFAAVYPVLRAMEEAGHVRRGYFVEGLGAAQFAASGAVDRLRDVRGPGDDPVVVTLAATDPAQPYGSALAWPPTEGRPARAAGAHVVLVDGAACLHIERGGRTLTTFPATQPALAAEAAADLVRSRRVGKLEVVRIDGAPAGDHPLADALRAAAFVDSPRGLSLRR